MQAKNVKEYESIRAEMLNVKDCITKYVGYVFGGSGAAIYGLSKMEIDGIPFVSCMLSLIISFVVVILFYKFQSHNRFAGYCKLLNQERYTIPISQNDTKDENKKDNDISFFSWELAVGKLRCLENNPKLLPNLINVIDIKIQNKKNLEEKIKKIFIDEKGEYLKGLWILIKALLGKIETSSWAFPPLIVSICFIFSFGFLIGSIWVYIKNGHSQFLSFFSDDFSYFFLFVALIQLILWFRLIGKLFNLMLGQTRIESFFWKFMPIRAYFLNNVFSEYKIIPSYFDTDDELDTGESCPTK